MANICDTVKGCICGSSGRACTVNESCVGGTCECLNNSACGGGTPYCWPTATSGIPASDGACHANQQLGASCTGNPQCYSNFCVDGVCCNSLCSGTGENCDVCDGSAAGTTKGMCGKETGAPHSAGTTTRSCTGSGTCGGSCNGISDDCYREWRRCHCCWMQRGQHRLRHRRDLQRGRWHERRHGNQLRLAFGLLQREQMRVVSIQQRLRSGAQLFCTIRPAAARRRS